MGIKDVQLKGKVVEMICKAGKESFCIFITHWIVVFNLDTKARNMLIRIGIENEGIHFLLIFVPAMIAVTMVAWAMKQIIVLEKKVLKL